jgi:hypothetical protein
MRTNEHTGRRFWAGRVRTLGGEIDVVADPELVGDEPTPEAIISVGGWIAGRVREARAVGRPARGLGRLLRRR